jgi:hypothetical protein
MRTVVALLMLALIVGGIVQACQPKTVPVPHMSTSQCEQLADAGKLQPDADGWIRCP